MTRTVFARVRALALTPFALAPFALAPFALTPCAFADHDKDGVERADGHAPIGVMADHTHDAGEVMVSYRYMRMDMSGSRIGTDSVSPLEIAQTVPNIFNTELGLPGQPPTLRVVPTDMTMDMHMLGAMWAPNDRVTLMAMGQYVIKEMDHVTFAGMVPPQNLNEDNSIGGFTTRSEGFGDTTVSALVNWVETDVIKSHLTVGVSLPTGSITETDDVLAPNGMRPTLRLPYPMQLGTGTVDPKLGYTITGRDGDVGFGVQANAVWRVEDNDEGYRFGDEYQLTAWGSYAPAPAVSISARLNAMTKGEVDGRDPAIAAPVQTANPDFQGGDQVDIGLGVNLLGQRGVVKGHRLAIEALFPVYRDLNGPQLETDWTVIAGWQYALP